MRILVIGGTWFLGKAIVEDALSRGWDVTTFNRGRSGADMGRGHRHVQFRTRSS
jgi:nucleoside-diphosphate-sugar epimerase